MQPKENNIVSGNVNLREISLSDIPKWCAWFNDSDVLQYSIHRSVGYSEGQQEAFLKDLQQHPAKVQFMICDTESFLRLGIISLAIESQNQSADVSIIVGERTMWGKGIAGDAIRGVINYGIDHHGLQRFTAGTDLRNVRSWRAFENCGFRILKIEKETIQYVDEARKYDKVKLVKLVD